jgi:uncharacterized protein
MINIKARNYNNLKNKMIGLIGQNNPKSIYFKTRFGIHTFGVKFPIDILILDNEFRVVKIKEKLKPYRVYFWNPKYNNILELPQNTINNKNIKLRDRIKIIYD